MKCPLLCVTDDRPVKESERKAALMHFDTDQVIGSVSLHQYHQFKFMHIRRKHFTIFRCFGDSSVTFIIE